VVEVIEKSGLRAVCRGTDVGVKEKDSRQEDCIRRAAAEEVK
jgi:hypothetical protein